MKVPYLPLSIDSFGGPAAKVCPSSPVFLLSHFHTDHMKGLSGSWCGGIIICSDITRALVLRRFGSELEDRVVGLPLWRRTRLLAPVSAVLGHHIGNAALPTDAHDTAEAVFVTLLPAFHIPGSVMFYLEAPFGALLYTGDFKFEAGTLAPTVLQAFFAAHRVDHVFIDDTWLHLGVEIEAPAQRRAWAGHAPPTSGITSTHREQNPAPSPTEGQEDEEDLFRVFDDEPVRAAAPVASGVPSVSMSGAKVLSKLLNKEQTAEAIEAIGRRMDYQRQQFRLSVQQADPTTALPPRIFPFKIRVYLHNQFGKELLIQQLATRLDTRALIDDDRYERLALVAAELNATVDGATTASPTHDISGTAAVGSSSQTVPEEEEEEESAAARIWDARGGEKALYPLQLDRFISHSQYRQLLDGFDAESNGTRLSRHDVARLNLPLIEVVGSRAKISDAALEEATLASFGAPFYGVVISGWARLQRRRGAPERIWQVPTTLHCAPDETIRFIEVLRPLSITPLHYRPSRAAIILQRLGPLLRTPFVNHYLHVPGGSGNASQGSALTATVRWLTPLAPHVPDRAGYDLQTLTAHTLARQQEQELEMGVRKGFRLRRDGDGWTGTHLSSAAGCRSDASAPVVPIWKVESLAHSLGARAKRPRDADGPPSSSGFSLDSLADLVDAKGTTRASAAPAQPQTTARELSMPPNTIIL